ncbi:MAG: hypothetical protein JW808_10660 [Victivallales bacterium]|nr:hypothetical protein [Victivallales bacterium]
MNEKFKVVEPISKLHVGARPAILNAGSRRCVRGHNCPISPDRSGVAFATKGSAAQRVGAEAQPALTTRSTRSFEIGSVFLIGLLFISVTGVFAGRTADASEVLIEFFFSGGCIECRRVENLVIPHLEEEHGGSFVIHRIDLGMVENVPTLVAYQEKFGITEDKPVSMVVNRKVFLNGYGEIEEGLLRAVAENIGAAPDGASMEDEAAVTGESQTKSRLGKFTLAAVLAAGLADGVNPCVFSALVFLVSLMSVSGIKGRRLLAAGCSYCLASFLTYLALGFGLTGIIRLFHKLWILQSIMQHAMAALLVALALLSFRDAWRYSKSRDAKDVRLQLPEKLKAAARTAMKKGLAARHVIPGAFLAGTLVTMVESVCTGQVYLPVMMMLSRAGNIRAAALLVAYNIAFIIPLLVVLAATFKGISNPAMVEWSKKNVVPSKIAIGLVLICLAVLLAIT